MKIQVTAKDIQEGRPGKVCACPIAIAGSRAYGCTMEVGNTLMGPHEELHCRNWGLLPKEAREFVTAFDNGRSVQPFEFEIEFNQHRETPY